MQQNILDVVFAAVIKSLKTNNIVSHGVHINSHLAKGTVEELHHISP